MQLLASSENYSISTTQEIPGILRVHYSAHKIRPLILTQSQNIPIQLHHPTY
jgi:hypothetical protein